MFFIVLCPLIFIIDSIFYLFKFIFISIHNICNVSVDFGLHELFDDDRSVNSPGWTTVTPTPCFPWQKQYVNRGNSFVLLVLWPLITASYWNGCWYIANTFGCFWSLEFSSQRHPSGPVDCCAWLNYCEKG